MEKFKKYTYIGIGFIVFCLIVFVVCGGLKMKSIDKTIEDANAIISVVEEYLNSDVVNIPAAETQKKVEEIYNHDRLVWRWVPQESNRDDYIDGRHDGLQEMESQMDIINSGMKVISICTENPDNLEKYAEEYAEHIRIIRDSVEKLRESTMPKTE